MNDFFDNTGSYGIVTQIWREILCFDQNCKIQINFGREGLFWEECTLGTGSTKAAVKKVRLKFVREDNALYRMANTLGW